MIGEGGLEISRLSSRKQRQTGRRYRDRKRPRSEGLIGLNVRNTGLAGTRTTTGSSNSGAVCRGPICSPGLGLAPRNKGGSRDAELRRDQEQGNNDNPPGLRRPRTAIAQAQPTKML